MLENLTAILRELTDVHRVIYEVSLEKKEAVVANDVQRVGEIVKQEWELLGKVSELEEKRIRVVCGIGCAKGIDHAAGMPLEEICKWGTPQEETELRNVAGELRKLATEQKKINAENQALIDLHLDYMDYMINVFLKEPQTSNIYGNSGEVEEDGPSDRRIIDSQV